MWRQDDLRINDAAFLGIVFCPAASFIKELLSGLVGRLRDGVLFFASRADPDLKMRTGHVHHLLSFLTVCGVAGIAGAGNGSALPGMKRRNSVSLFHQPSRPGNCKKQASDGCHPRRARLHPSGCIIAPFFEEDYSHAPVFFVFSNNSFTSFFEKISFNNTSICASENSDG